MLNQKINKDSVQKFLDSLENTLGTRRIDKKCDTTKIIRFQAGDTKYGKAFHYEYNLTTKKLGFHVEYKKSESEIFEKLVSYISFCFAEKKDYLNNLPVEEVDAVTVQKKWTINENIETLEKFKERLNDLISIFEPILCGVNFFTPDQGVLVQKVVLKQYEVESKIRKLEKRLWCPKSCLSIEVVLSIVIIALFCLIIVYEYCAAKNTSDNKSATQMYVLVNGNEFNISPSSESIDKEEQSLPKVPSSEHLDESLSHKNGDKK